MLWIDKRWHRRGASAHCLKCPYLPFDCLKDLGKCRFRTWHFVDANVYFWCRLAWSPEPTPQVCMATMPQPFLRNSRDPRAEASLSIEQASCAEHPKILRYFKVILSSLPIPALLHWHNPFSPSYAELFFVPMAGCDLFLQPISWTSWGSFY